MSNQPAMGHHTGALSGHILPNSSPPASCFTVNIAYAIVVEAALSWARCTSRRTISGIPTPQPMPSNAPDRPLPDWLSAWRCSAQQLGTLSATYRCEAMRAGEQSSERRQLLSSKTCSRYFASFMEPTLLFPPLIGEIDEVASRSKTASHLQLPQASQTTQSGH
jgi:hypothetical protein